MADKLIYVPNDDTKNYPSCTEIKISVWNVRALILMNQRMTPPSLTKNSDILLDEIIFALKFSANQICSSRFSL